MSCLSFDGPSGKPETRNPKSESNPKPETRNRERGRAKVSGLGFGFLTFIRISGFGFLVSLPLVSGCGYQVTGANNASLYRQNVKTVAVPMITNRSYRRGLEVELTKSVIQQLEEHSPYKVVPKERADTILECEIYAAQVNLLGSDSTTGLPQEQEFTIVVNFTWKDLRTGDILCERKNFDQRSNFMPTLGESSSVASTNAIQQLGLAIVQEIQADW
jgi:hypothetical protein